MTGHDLEGAYGRGYVGAELLDLLECTVDRLGLRSEFFDLVSLFPYDGSLISEGLMGSMAKFLICGPTTETHHGHGDHFISPDVNSDTSRHNSLSPPGLL